MNRSWDCLGFRNGGEGDHEGGEGGVGVGPFCFFAFNASHQFTLRLFQPLLFGILGFLVFCLICI